MLKPTLVHTIENDSIRVSIHEKGAELRSVHSKKLECEYMWNGDPAFWDKHSPVLFPIVGALRENTYYYNNKPYQLPRHGFAREKTFPVIDQSASSITFSLRDDEETLLVYPFNFELRIQYNIHENTLRVTYEVHNRSDHEMYFSIGGHPAFKVPLLKDTAYEDHYLEFNKAEVAQRWPVTRDGLIDDNSIPIFKGESVLPLAKELFLRDALVFKDLVSKKVALKCTKHTHGLSFDFTGFPYMGIWAAKNANFVCIEPWCGVADGVHASQQLTDKEGINRLNKGQSFTREWKVEIW